MKYFYSTFLSFLFVILIACSQQSLGPKEDEGTSDAKDPSITPIETTENNPNSTPDDTSQPAVNGSSQPSSQTSPVNTGDSSGYSSLHRAVENDDLTQIKNLVQQGADVNEVRSSDQFTPLMLAIIRSNLEVVNFLIENGAQVTDRLVQFATNTNATSEIQTALEGARLSS